MKEFGNRLTALRKGAGLTQEELGKALGISRSTVAMYEKGEREPALSQLCRLAEVLGTDVNDLLGVAPADSAARQILALCGELSPEDLQTVLAIGKRLKG